MWSPVQAMEPNSNGKRVPLVDRFGIAGVKAGPNSSAVRQQLAQKSKAMAAEKARADALQEQWAVVPVHSPQSQI